MQAVGLGWGSDDYNSPCRVAFSMPTDFADLVLVQLIYLN